MSPSPPSFSPPHARADASNEQETVAAGLALLRHAVEQVDRTGVFSSNETEADIATADLKYALASFYLAEVASRVRTPDPSARLPVVTECAESHERFLSLCEAHELLPAAIASARERAREGGEVAGNPADARGEKIARFKRSQEVKKRLEALEASRRSRREAALLDADWDDEDPEDAPPGAEDEEEERERWLLLIEDAVTRAVEAQPRHDMELEMLRNREELERTRPRPAPGRERERERGMGNVFIPGRPVDGGGLGGWSLGGLASGGSGDVGIAGVGGGGTRSIPPEVLAAMTARGSGVYGGVGPRSRDALAREVFRPSHILPTMTIEEAGVIEYRELMERTAREARNKAAREREESEMTEEEKEERELLKARQWDEFKDDNPYGHGNSKLRPCS